jgi:hypothetical protein
MLFVSYNQDGSIHQANKVYDPRGYGKLLNEVEHRFVTSKQHAGPVNPEHWLVQKGFLTERPDMPITISKTTVKAGSSDSAVFKGIPKGAKFDIHTMGVLVWQESSEEELEVSVPVPCIYKVRFHLWPYKTFEASIEATT